MFVPPFLPHLEANMSTTEELWWIACRSPENIVVNLADVPDACSRVIERPETFANINNFAFFPPASKYQRLSLCKNQGANVRSPRSSRRRPVA